MLAKCYVGLKNEFRKEFFQSYIAHQNQYPQLTARQKKIYDRLHEDPEHSSVTKENFQADFIQLQQLRIKNQISKNLQTPSVQEIPAKEKYKDTLKTILVFLELFFHNNLISKFPLKKLAKNLHRKICNRNQYQ